MHENLLSNDDVLNILFRELEDARHGTAEICDGALRTKRNDQARQWTQHGTVDDPSGAAGVIHDFFS